MTNNRESAQVVLIWKMGQAEARLPSSLQVFSIEPLNNNGRPLPSFVSLATKLEMSNFDTMPWKISVFVATSDTAGKAWDNIDGIKLQIHMIRKKYNKVCVLCVEHNCRFEGKITSDQKTRRYLTISQVGTNSKWLYKWVCPLLQRQVCQQRDFS